MAGNTKSLSLLICLCMVFYTTGARYVQEVASSGKQCGGKKVMFVFGDSYVDSGNGMHNEPYGMTFPGHPSGRFSDGRVLTDYLASFLGIDSLVPSSQISSADKKQLQNGLNFATGGSGLFNTAWTSENMSAQMNKLKQLISQNTYSPCELNSSIAFVHTSGNDYVTFAKNHNNQELSSYRKVVINKLAENLKTIHSWGVPKVAVSMMAPTGCAPEYANNSTSYPKNCDRFCNSNVTAHNQMLKTAVHKLNNKAQSPTPPFVLIDLYNAFQSALDQHARTIENPKYKNPGIACCKGIDSIMCGQRDNAGNKMYTVCDHPELSFFWDLIHPTQHGWSYVYSALRDSLNQLL